MSVLPRDANGSLAEQIQQRLEARRAAQKREPQEEDYVALVDACCEQDMRPYEILTELRALNALSLREAVDYLCYYAQRSTNPATIARRQQFAELGRRR